MLRDRWKEALSRTKRHWEDKRVNRDDPEGVIAGLQPIRNVPHHEKLSNIELLNHGQRGRSVVFPANVLRQSALSILELYSDNKNSRVITVTLTMAPQPGAVPFVPGVNGLFDVTGLIEWGAGGVQASAEIDWLQGTTFSLACSYLRISAFGGTQAPGVQPPVVGAFVGYETVNTNRGRTPQFTDIGGVAFPATFVELRPNFAQNVRVYRNAQPGASSTPIRVEYLDQLFAVRYIEDYGLGVNMQRPTDLSNDIRAIRIGATVPSILTAYSVWGLCF